MKKILYTFIALFLTYNSALAKRYIAKEYIYMKYGLNENEYNDSINGKYYIDGMPEESDGASVVISNYPIKDRKYEKIGSYYIMIYNNE